MRSHTRGDITALAVALGLLGLFGLLLALVFGGGGAAPTARRAVGRPGRAGGTARSFPPAVTLVATPHGAIAKFARPGGPQTGMVPGSWHHAPSTLPVIAKRPGWLKLRLAQRPDESTAWVLSRDVTLSSTHYAIVLDLAATHLSLYRDGHKIFSAPVGVGTRQFPTPTGTFFVAFVARPPIPAYGAFVMVTSAHSKVITDWNSSGDAMVAIHGPLFSGRRIGTTGARVSHGCIRMHENALLHLRHLPMGTPIFIEHD
jgi:lipoprotein-anchoring transpeptidase ErfK/SrfK